MTNKLLNQSPLGKLFIEIDVFKARNQITDEDIACMTGKSRQQISNYKAGKVIPATEWLQRVSALSGDLYQRVHEYINGHNGKE